MKSTVTKKEETKKEKFDLQEAFTLWRNESKGSKSIYYSGFDLNKNKMIGFDNKEKKNEKEPDIRLFYLNAEGKAEDKACVGLWFNESKAKNTYLSGTTNENEKVIAFLGDVNQDKRPYIRGYFQKDSK